MELDTVDKHREAFYRLVGTESDDPALTDRGEETDEVVDLYLTRGCRVAQRWMLKMGYDGWRERSSVLSWSGTDAADGGRYSDLPSDFLRAFGNQRVSALREADGRPWGVEMSAEDDFRRGSFYYIRGEQLWIGHSAVPPGALYLAYHYRHPKWEGLTDNDIDFPMEARPLIVAEAANLAKEENWLPGGPEMERKIERARARAREEARDVARPTKQPRQMRQSRRVGNRW